MDHLQCKMALAGLGWTLDTLADASGISRRTVARFAAHGQASSETVEKLRQTLVAAGAEFINGGKLLGVKVPRKDGE